MPPFLTVRLADTLLPIVDVTNPAFAIAPSAEELAAMSAKYVEESRSQDVPPQLREALSRSRLGSGLMAARGTFLSGLNTYLLKVGPENLPANFEAIDRRIAASFPAVTTRLRLQDMASLMSEGLTGVLAAGDHRPVHFINIAGGPAADTWNTLIQLKCDNRPLGDREISISVLDVDREGPEFGARALEALQGSSGPLQGMRLRFRHHSYHWAEPGELRQFFELHELQRSVCAVSSEGGLFEYGSDEEIAGNLTTLAELTPSDTVVVGSACRAGELTRVHSGIGVTLRPRTPEAFRDLVEQTGWEVDRIIERPFSDNFRLVKRRTR
jgi:hypothetical protein